MSATVPGLDLLWFCQLAADGEFIGSGPMRRPTLPYLASLGRDFSSSFMQHGAT